jgi:hypothetical protein
LELPGYVKTSGADGIHVLASIQRRATFEDTYAFAEAASRLLEARHPGKATTEWLKKKRSGVLVDHRENGWGKTIAYARVDAAPLGRADARGEAARLHDGGRTCTGGGARRPVRAGARGSAAVRRSAQTGLVGLTASG